MVDPSEFIFYPTRDDRPLKPRALVTLINSAPLENPNFTASGSKQIDFYAMAVMFQAYTFLHKNTTKLPNNTEFLVIITYKVPEHYRQILLLMGARLLVIPPLIVDHEQDGRYNHIYTKLYMWRLENIYDSLMFIDGDLFFFNKTPISLWELLDERDELEPGGDVFGACKDWASDWPVFGHINVGLILFRPSLFHFWNLIERAGKKEYKEYYEQQLISKYFVEENPHLYVEFNAFYNVIHVGERTPEEQMQIIGYHQKFWDGAREFNKTILWFDTWSTVMHQVRRQQIELYRNLEYNADESHPRLPVVPAIPDSYDVWCRVNASNVMFDMVAILSSSLAPTEILESRQVYADRYYQAHHTTFPASPPHDDPNHSVSATNFRHALSTILQLFKTYDWVWYMQENIYLNETLLPFHVPLGIVVNETEKDLIVFDRKCGGSEHASSFLIHQRLQEELKEFHDATYREPWSNWGMPDNEIWGKFLDSLNESYILTAIKLDFRDDSTSDSGGVSICG
ncbi:UNVERIFIED_CONTAM: hypothetical protein HDU68_010199 [Siphonaria sp. JEL0065]|nr:hypothetical protein HDU68_010199 [Siphonaria sp. JEL0065]